MSCQYLEVRAGEAWWAVYSGSGNRPVLRAAAFGRCPTRETDWRVWDHVDRQYYPVAITGTGLQGQHAFRFCLL